VAFTGNTVATYITATQRLLHDVTAQYWSTQELTDYINDARFRVVRDSGCLRTLQTVTLVQGQEVYPIATTLPNAQPAFDILNINIIWGNSRIPLLYRPWTAYNQELRYWQQYQGRPCAFSIYGQLSVYLGPSPDQNYVSEWDTIISPYVFVSPTDPTIDAIPLPYQTPVPYYAAYTAKQKMQQWDEARWFERMYKSQINSAINSAYTRRLQRAV